MMSDRRTVLGAASHLGRAGRCRCRRGLCRTPLARESLTSTFPHKAVAILRPLADHGSGRLLVEDASIARYYLPAGSQWQRWSSTRNITLPSGASTGGPSSSAGVTGTGNAGVFAEFITHGYFSLIALNFADTTTPDHRLAGQLHRDPHYRTIAVVPYGTEIPPTGQGTYVIWRYEPQP
jgi:hypothetical protein